MVREPVTTTFARNNDNRYVYIHCISKLPLLIPSDIAVARVEARSDATPLERTTGRSPVTVTAA
jgi:hypothetical protein